MRNIYLILPLFLLSYAGNAQQEQMYTQFMFNKLAYNPGYAGSFVSPTLTAIYRNQWMGLDGAPDAQALTYTQSVANDQVGIGGSIIRQHIGITTNLTFEFPFAYRIKMRRGVVAAGLQVSMRNLRQNWGSDKVKPLDQGDQAIPTEPKSKFLTNFGAGVYYVAYNNKWFAGFGVPRLVTNSIDFADYGSVFSREVPHFNAMGGMTFQPNKDVEITPQALFRYAIGAPFDAEVNVSVLLKKKFYGGLTYRAGGDTKGLGESVDAMLGVQVTDNLFFSLSYDIGFTRLRKYNSGSVEATARWWFNPPGNVEDVVPPRPF